MKKICCAFLALLLCFGVFGCKQNNDDSQMNGSKLLKECNVESVSVSSIPENYEYSFGGDDAKAIVDYIEKLNLITDFKENPNEYGGMTWVISIEYENGDHTTVYHFGNMFIRTENGSWYKMKSEEAQRFEYLLNDLSISQKTPNSVLKIWEGKFSEHKLISGIENYVANYNNIMFKTTTLNNCVTFDVDFEIASCSVSRLSKVDDKDINIELNGYIDTYIATSIDGNKATIYTDWWFRSSGWVKDVPIWSYLIHMNDVQGNEYYYYFRTDYSAFQS